MTKFWNFLMKLAEAIHTARTATYLTRNGRWDEAQKLFSK